VTLAVSTVLTVPVARALSPVPAVPAVQTIPVSPVVLVSLVPGIDAAGPTPGATSAGVHETEDENGCGHPPDGAEEAEAEQGHEEDEK
jgi:hypothetical protein